MKRITVQRNLVLEAVKIMKNHPTADEVFLELSKAYPSISRGTVYRNLNALADDGEISKIAFTNGADCFDHIVENHYHAKCKHCSKVVDVDFDVAEGLIGEVGENSSFILTGYSIVFHGYCKKCHVN